MTKHIHLIHFILKKKPNNTFSIEKNIFHKIGEDFMVKYFF